MWIKLALLVPILLAAFTTAHAQAPPAPVTPMADTAAPELQRPTACVPLKPGVRDPNASQGTTVGQANEALGDKLAKSDGVLCPPAGVDPEMRAPTPDAGNTPVIPPPGSPGGDPTVRPK